MYYQQSYSLPMRIPSPSYSIAQTPDLIFRSNAPTVAYAASVMLPQSTIYIQSSNSSFDSNTSLSSPWLNQTNSNFSSNIISYQPPVANSYSNSMPITNNSLTSYTSIPEPIIPEIEFQPNNFISPGFQSEFIGKAKEIKDAIYETFTLLTGKELPSNIIFSIVTQKELRERGMGLGVMGVSYNRTLFGMSEILVKEGSLASVMLTMGHEIGHVLTPTLADKSFEEAKAYAFQFAWMQVIQDNNIKGLQNAFVEFLPAQNGIHDKRYAFVKKQLHLGKTAIQIYKELSKQEH